MCDVFGGDTVDAGTHQRWWVHLLRDLHALTEASTAKGEALGWASIVRALSDEAQMWLHAHPQPTDEEREQQDMALTAHIHALGLQCARTNQLPCQALGTRLLRHDDERCQIVLVDRRSADHNLVERRIRPLVVIRTISGGSRSAEDTNPRMALASLGETWQARGVNPFDECLRLLSQAAAS